MILQNKKLEAIDPIDANKMVAIEVARGRPLGMVARKLGGDRAI